jgi:hypothetical protein
MGQLLPWPTTLIQGRNGTELASFTTAATLLPATALWTMPPNWCVPDKQLLITAAGSVSNVVTAAPTFTLEFRLGPTANIAVWSGGAMQTSTTAHTTVPWFFSLLLTVDTVGASTVAKMYGMGTILSRAFQVGTAGADNATLMTSLILPTTAPPVVGTGFDSTVSNIADLRVACSVSNASNKFKLDQYSLVALN